VPSPTLSSGILYIAAHGIVHRRIILSTGGLFGLFPIQTLFHVYSYVYICNETKIKSYVVYCVCINMLTHH